MLAQVYRAVACGFVDAAKRLPVLVHVTVGRVRGCDVFVRIGRVGFHEALEPARSSQAVTVVVAVLDRNVLLRHVLLEGVLERSCDSRSVDFFLSKTMTPAAPDEGHRYCQS